MYVIPFTNFKVSFIPSKSERIAVLSGGVPKSPYFSRHGDKVEGVVFPEFLHIKLFKLVLPKSMSNYHLGLYKLR